MLFRINRSNRQESKLYYGEEMYISIITHIYINEQHINFIPKHKICVYTQNFCMHEDYLNKIIYELKYKRTLENSK